MIDADRGGRVPAMAWIVWGLVATFYFYGSFQRVAPAVMVGELMADFNAGGAILGSLSAFYFYAYAGLQLPAGLLLDRWGERRCLIGSVLLCGAGSLLFAVADSLAAAYLGRFLIGAGAAFTWIGCLTVASSWFPASRFALVAGMGSLAGMLGAIAAQAPLAALVTAFGWRDSMLWSSAFAFLTAIGIALLVRDRPRKDGARRAVLTLRQLVAGLREVAADGQLWFAALACCLMSTPVLAFAGLWGVPYLETIYGLSRPGAALVASSMMVGWAVGGPVFGWLSDRTGRRRRPMIVGASGSLLTMTALLYLPELPVATMALLLFVNGFTAGAAILTFSVIRDRHGAGNLGSAYGVVNTIVMGSGAVFQPAIGALLDLNWDGRLAAGARVYSAGAYEIAFLTLPAAFAGGVVMTVLIRETWCRPVAPARRGRRLTAPDGAA